MSKVLSWWIHQLSLDGIYISFVAQAFCQSHAGCIWAEEHSEFHVSKFHFTSPLKSTLKVLFFTTALKSWSSWIQFIGRAGARRVFAFIVFIHCFLLAQEKVKAKVSSAKYGGVFFLSSNTMQHEREDFLNSNRERASSIDKENANGGNKTQMWAGSLFCL